ncbi:hypothetical protein ARMA_2403 [Ardenticatena maritima]|uniref:Uncharacterized protein n=1 Tax=Ardenticatena maritima TaxID=872965 RepID=A0A0M9UDI4_9CHLR|nr:hypothetical protein ARMA_2403 [Ardenticatena maritima]
MDTFMVWHIAPQGKPQPWKKPPRVRGLAMWCVYAYVPQ